MVQRLDACLHLACSAFLNKKVVELVGESKSDLDHPVASGQMGVGREGRILQYQWLLYLSSSLQNSVNQQTMPQFSHPIVAFGSLTQFGLHGSMKRSGTKAVPS